MKTYPLTLEDNFHNRIKRSALNAGESIKEFILNAIQERLRTTDYFTQNKELQEDVKNRDKIDFIEVKSIKEIFK